MALSISSATSGADSAGLEELYRKIHAHCIEDAKSMVSKTGNIKKALKNCWQGIDEEKFEDHLDTFVGQVNEALTAYDEAIKTEFNSVFQEWVQFQNSHVS